MNQLEKGKIQEIITLHNEIAGHLRLSLEKAIKIGELLIEQKKTLGHGGFTPWINDNLPFTQRTAQNYMRVYKERDELKNESVSYLGEAYKLLEAPKAEIEGPEMEKFREYEKALESCRIELEALKILEQEIDKKVDAASKVTALGHLSNKALTLQNKIFEIRIRGDREAGRLLLELEKRAPGIDWMEIIQDDNSYQHLQGAINERIQQLS